MWWFWNQQRKAYIHSKDLLWRVWNGDNELIRLTSDYSYDGGMNRKAFKPEFVGTTPALLEEVLWRDPRDVPWSISECGSDEREPFCRYDVSWVASQQLISLKYYGFYRTSPPRAQNPKIAQERAPMEWGRAADVPVVKASLASGEQTSISAALGDLRHCAASQAPWAHALLLEYVNDPIAHLRSSAISGIGEIARVHGYSKPAESVPAITGALADEWPGIRAAAAQSLDEIARFTN